MRHIVLFMFDSPVQIALVVGVIVLIFGAGKLPQLARSIGQSRKAFKEGMREAEEEEEEEQAKIAPAPAAPQIGQVSDADIEAELKRRAEARAEH
jgi:sec-independent protein translocase protein TatA